MFIRVKVQGQTSAKCNYFQWNRKTYFIKLHQFLISSFSVTGLTHEHTQTQRVRSKTIPCFRRFSSAQSKYSVQCIRIKEDQSYRQVETADTDVVSIQCPCRKSISHGRYI